MQVDSSPMHGPLLPNYYYFHYYYYYIYQNRQILLLPLKILQLHRQEVNRHTQLNTRQVKKMKVRLQLFGIFHLELT